MHSYASLSQRIRSNFPHIRQVLLSHGVHTIDYVIRQKILRNREIEDRLRPIVAWVAGTQLMHEAEQRRWFDAVLTLSPFEVEIEKWLGGIRVLWVPRTVTELPLRCTPIDGIVGCVSTLSHTPNFWGLVTLLDELTGIVPPNFRFRLIGQSESEGKRLAGRYDFLDYLGVLPDHELRQNAATWCCFVNSIFEYAKGCSTKLGVCLGWGLPIATTEFGVRGYRWDINEIPLAQTPAELARLVYERSRVENFKEYAAGTEKIKKMAPEVCEIAAEVRKFLCRDTRLHDRPIGKGGL
jgi:hypothetical protein